MDDDKIKKTFSKESALGILIIGGFIWDLLITLTIFGVVFAIKHAAIFLGVDSEILITRIDFITDVGVPIIFTLWFILTIANVLKFMRRELISSKESSKEADGTKAGGEINGKSAEITQRTYGIC